jgi:hypothetical protein
VGEGFAASILGLKGGISSMPAKRKAAKKKATKKAANKKR